MGIPDDMLVSYYDHGGLRFISEIKEDQFNHGLYVRWYDNGKKAEESNFANGMLHGSYRDWRKNGRKWEQSSFVNGKEHGMSLYWHNSDNLDDYQEVSVKFYNNGNDITEEVCSIINDVANITEEEKTQIALQYGIVL